MANPVTDKLSDWQADADAADTNLPTNATNIGDGQAGDLDGEFRRVKSEMRSESIIKSWERWRGLKNLAASGNIAFTYSSPTVFTVNDDFLNANRNVAVVGRRVKAVLSGSSVYGRISASSFSSPNTTVTCVWDSAAMDATMTEIQFGVEARAVGGVQGVPFASTAPVVHQIYRSDGTLMAPVYETGILPLTNRTGAGLAAGDVVTVDTANDTSVVLGDTSQTKKQLVVSIDAPANTAVGRFLRHGVALVNVTGTVVRGNYLAKSATSKVAFDTAIAQADAVNMPSGAFAVALTAAAGPGAGAVYALVLGSSYVPVFGVAPVTQAFGDAAAEGNSAEPARANHVHGMPNAARLYDRAATQLSIVNDASEQTLYSFSVGANDLGTTKTLRVKIFGDYLNNSAAGRTFNLRISLGATDLYLDTSINLAVSASRRSFILEFNLANQNSAAVQVLNGWLRVSSPTAPTTGFGNLGVLDTLSSAFGGTAAENTTGALTLSVKLQHSAANASLDIRRNYAYAELI